VIYYPLLDRNLEFGTAKLVQLLDKSAGGIVMLHGIHMNCTVCVIVTIKDKTVLQQINGDVNIVFSAACDSSVSGNGHERLNNADNCYQVSITWF